MAKIKIFYAVWIEDGYPLNSGGKERGEMVLSENNPTARRDGTVPYTNVWTDALSSDLFKYRMNEAIKNHELYFLGSSISYALFLS